MSQSNTLVTAKAAMGAALRDAKAATGVGREKDKPPEDIKEAWDALDIPNITTADEIEREIVNKKAEMDCMETVDPKIVANYRLVTNEFLSFKLKWKWLYQLPSY